MAHATKLKINKVTAMIAAAGVAASIAACSDRADRVTYMGATTLLPSMTELASRFPSIHPEIVVDTAGGGTSKGISSVESGAANLGGAARELTNDEHEAVWAVPLARDAIAIVVNEALDLQAITTDRLRAVYTAPIGAPVVAGLTRVSKSWSHGTAKAFARGVGVDVADIRSEVEAGSNGKVLAIVQATANAIGYVSWGEARAAIAAGAPIRILAVDDVAPDLKAIGDGRYGLIRTLYLLLPKPGQRTTSPATTAFVKFIEGAEGDETLLKHGLVPIKPGQ